MAVEGIIIELGSTDQIDVDIGSTEHIEGGPGEAKFLPGPQGPQGETGEPGVSVSDISVERTSGTGAAGTTDTYTGTVTFSNGTSTTFTFDVYNGADGQGSGDMMKSVYDTDNDGVVDDAEKLGGQSPNYYAKATNGIYYAKTAGTGVAQVATIPGITQYYDGLCVALIFNVATRSDATININNLGAVPLRENTDTEGAAGNESIYSPGGAMRVFVYDADNALFRGVYDYSAYDRIHMVATEGSNAEKQANKISHNSNYFHAPCYQLVYFSVDNSANSALTLTLWTGPFSWSKAPIYINGEASSATNYTLPKGLYLVLWDGTNYYVNTNGTLPGTQAPLTFDSTPTDDSDNPVTSGGVYDALAPLRSVDATPTQNSTNLVQSGGVYGVVSNRNLIDNPWFTVNQRGQNSYTGNAYTVDRWRFQNNNGTCSIVSGGITFSNGAGGYGYFAQNLDFTMDGAKTYTLSVIADGQVYSAQSGGPGITLSSGLLFYFGSSTQISVRVPTNLNSSEVISAVKLELGSVSTLANDAPPNYAEELAKCQRYYWDAGFSTTIIGIFSSLSNIGGNSFTVIVPTPVPMRAVTPTINATVHWVRGNGSQITGYALNTSGVAIANGFVYGIALDKTSGYTPLQTYVVAFSKLTVSCDL